ncbi:hypothetical protein FACS1894202_13490 [Clostridia bacterium]|nr:hypothetical protein FACS1894202_13490 [Clostridia bacterium]
MKEWIIMGISAAVLIAAGWRVFWNAIKNIARGEVFDENFLMSLASIAAFAIGEYPEAAAIMLFYRIGEYFQDYAVDKSRDSIAALSDLRPDRAFLVSLGDYVPPDEVKVGDIIEIKAGERVALDGVVVDGASFVDTSALTGESVPRKVEAGAEVLAGCVNTSGRLLVEVSRLASDSAVSRILELVENASAKKAKTEKFITRFAKIYTPIVTLSALLLAVIAPLFLGGEWSEWIRRGVVFLVVSCPCALVISVPLGFFGGIGAASRRGILVKGGNYLELLSKTATVVFDKTGTLTKGVFNVSQINPVGATADELLAIAAHAERFSEHPIASSLRAAHSCGDCGSADVTDAEELSGKGVSAVVKGVHTLVGTSGLLKEHGIDAPAVDSGGTVAHVAENGVYRGHIVISDEIKGDARAAIAALKQAGVKKTVMLTGDAESVGRCVAAELGVDEAYTELLPAGKVEKVESLLGGGVLVFVGDGINDAPVLARSDVGVAMGGGRDAAIEAADAVIMGGEPSKVAAAIKIARRTMRVVKQNIVFSLGVKAAVLILGALGIASMWLAVFADVGVTFLAVINALRLLSPSVK